MSISEQAKTTPLPVGAVDRSTLRKLPPPTQGRGGNFFPNIDVFAHTGEHFKLYDDLIRDKLAIVNFMSIRGEQVFPASAHMAKVAAALGKQLGRDVFIYSITTEPELDSPEELHTFAKMHGAPRGWYFLSATRSGSEAVSKRLKPEQHGPSAAHTSRLIHYGNGSAGVWGAFAVDSEPGFIAERMTWVKSGAPRPTKLRRAGPRLLAATSAHLSHNREV